MKNIGLLALVGAHLYGGETETSDKELTGVYITPIRNLLALRKDPQRPIRYQEGSLDCTMVELNHFVYQTAIKQNPFYIELPFVPYCLEEETLMS